MTNWVSNRLRFSGSRAVVSEFGKVGFTTENSHRYVLNFDAFAPMPAQLREALRRDDNSHEETKALNEWQYRNWGCRWLFEEFRFVDSGPEIIEIVYSTPFSAPELILPAIVRRFPEARVWSAACERAIGYGFRFVGDKHGIESGNVAIDAPLLRDVFGDSWREPESLFDLPGIAEISYDQFIRYLTEKTSRPPAALGFRFRLENPDTTNIGNEPGPERD